MCIYIYIYTYIYTYNVYIYTSLHLLRVIFPGLVLLISWNHGGIYHYNWFFHSCWWPITVTKFCKKSRFLKETGNFCCYYAMCNSYIAWQSLINIFKMLVKTLPTTNYLQLNMGKNRLRRRKIIESSGWLHNILLNYWEVHETDYLWTRNLWRGYLTFEGRGSVQYFLYFYNISALL